MENYFIKVKIKNYLRGVEGCKRIHCDRLDVLDVRRQFGLTLGGISYFRKIITTHFKILNCIGPAVITKLKVGNLQFSRHQTAVQNLDRFTIN